MGRMIGTAIVGMLFAGFIAIDLMVFGVVGLDSPVLVVALVVGLLGGGLGGWAVNRRRGRALATS